TIWTFSTFDVIYLLTGGGPGGSTRPFVVFAYEKAFQGWQFGPGAAVALMMVPILAIFIFFLARYMRRADQQVQVSGLDRFFEKYGKTLLYGGLILFAIMLFVLNSGMFIRAMAILAVVLGLGVGFGYLSAYLSDKGEARSRAQGKVRTQTMKERPNVLGRLPAWVALAILLFFVLAPFYWMIITAFKSELQVTSQQGSVFWPQPWTLGQFQKLTSEHPFWTWFRNSAIVAICTTLIAVTFAALAGYALARLRFRGAQGLTGVVLLTYLVPGALLFIPLYQILSRLHLINTLGSLI